MPSKWGSSMIHSTVWISGRCFTNLTYWRSSWHGLHLQRLICVSASKSRCTSLTVNSVIWQPSLLTGCQSMRILKTAPEPFFFAYESATLIISADKSTPRLKTCEKFRIIKEMRLQSFWTLKTHSHLCAFSQAISKEYRSQSTLFTQN
jgi:hypothetical protein